MSDAPLGLRNSQHPGLPIRFHADVDEKNHSVSGLLVDAKFKTFKYPDGEQTKMPIASKRNSLSSPHCDIPGTNKCANLWVSSAFPSGWQR